MAIGSGRNLVEILFKAKDEASATIAKINEEIKKLGPDTAVAQAATAKFATAVTGLKVAAGAAAAVLVAAGAAMYGLASKARDGVEAIEELRQAAINMAAAVTSNDPSIPFERALMTTTRMVEQIQYMDRAFVGTADELTTLADAMTTYGLGLNLATEEAQKQFVTFGNIIKVMTRGQAFQIQAFQEIRALMDGHIMRGAMLVQKLEAAGINVKEMVPVWREQGTLLKNIIELLPGYLQAATEIEKTFTAQLSTMETIHKKILRDGFAKAYEDIVGLMGQAGKLLMDQNGLTAAGKKIVDAIRFSWFIMWNNLKNIVVTAWNLIKPFAELFALVLPGIAAFYSGVLKTTAVVRVLSEYWLVIAGMVKETVSAFGGFLKGMWKLLQGDVFGASAIFTEIRDSFAEKMAEASKRFKQGFMSDIRDAIRQVDLMNPLNPMNWTDEGEYLGVPMEAPGAPGKKKESEKELDKHRDSLKKSMKEIEDLRFSAAQRQLAVENELAADLAEAWKSVGDKYAETNEKMLGDMKALGKSRGEIAKASQDLLLATIAEGQAREAAIRDKYREKDLKDERDALQKETAGIMEELKRREDAMAAFEDKKGEARGRLYMAWSKEEELVDAIRAERKKWSDLRGDLPEDMMLDTLGYEEAAINKLKVAYSDAFEWINNLYADHMAGMANTFDNLFFDAFTGKLKTMGDYWKSLTENIAGAWSRMIADMVAKWLSAQILKPIFSGVMTMVMGAKDGGVFPGTFVPIRAFDTGGVVTHPTLGMIAETGKPEAVVPLKSGKIPVELNGDRTVRVEVVNNTGVAAAATKAEARIDGTEMVVTVFLDALRRNAYGLRTALTGG